MIYNKLPSEELRANAIKMGMRTLRKTGCKVISGMTSLSEVLAAHKEKVIDMSVNSDIINERAVAGCG